MESGLMLVVQIEKPENKSLAAWFSELRLWLDENHCQPSIFFPSDKITSGLCFDIIFSYDEEAHRFSSYFENYSTCTRRPTSIEQAGILDHGENGRVIGTSAVKRWA
jgi:hypothetical protein